MMISSPMMGLMDMVILRIDKNLLGKVLPILLGIMKIGCLTLYHKELVMNPYVLLVLGVGRYMRVDV